MRIKPTRVYNALIALADWCSEVNSQKAQHLWPLLALLERGVNSSTTTEFREEHDFDFWNRFHRLPGENRPTRDGDSWQKHYYVNPLDRLIRDADHPHRGPSTIRLRTFANSWRAAEETDDKWKLSHSYASIFRAKALTKGGVITQCPVVDLAVWLFRAKDFPAGSNASTLKSEFRKVFRQADSDFESIFRFDDEPAENIFTDRVPTDAEYRSEIERAIIKEVSGQDEPMPSGMASASVEPEPLLEDDDPVMLEVSKLLSLGSSGLILRGCPGTGKTWYARRIARKLVADPNSDVFSIQFHPSYGYEDFVEGYKPDENSRAGFSIVDKVLLRAVAAAQSKPTRVVLIIDEINRGDPARILGEVLTYIESSYRGETFLLPYSGSSISIPVNLVILGTMNPHDRSIAQLDMAFLRRFDHIEVKPSSEVAASFLEQSPTLTVEQIGTITKWFEELQRDMPFGIGHAYLSKVRSVDDLRTVWKYRMWPFCETILELDESKRGIINAKAEKMFRDLLQQPVTD
jgi:5-methylcytosine-specific restriction enzyme B